VSTTYLSVECQGAIALVHAYLATPFEDLRFLSIGGPTEAVQAVIAGALQGERLTLFRKTESPDPLERHRAHAGWLTPPRIGGRCLTRRLPCGQCHGLYYPNISPETTRDNFSLILPAVERPQAPAALLRLLDRRTTLPLHPSWAAWLWDYFDAEDALTPLHGEGPWIGWDFHLDSKALTAAVTSAIKQRRLGVAA
jgi:hypothetical protein